MERATRSASKASADLRRAERLAFLLAAKEAVFKALDAPWMGLAGFADIRIQKVGRGKWTCRVGGKLAKYVAGKKLELDTARNKGSVIAFCYALGTHRKI